MWPGAGCCGRSDTPPSPRIHWRGRVPPDRITRRRTDRKGPPPPGPGLRPRRRRKKDPWPWRPHCPRPEETAYNRSACLIRCCGWYPFSCLPSPEPPDSLCGPADRRPPAPRPRSLPQWYQRRPPFPESKHSASVSILPVLLVKCVPQKEAFLLLFFPPGLFAAKDRIPLCPVPDSPP